jgi:hypothetical protein
LCFPVIVVFEGTSFEEVGILILGKVFEESHVLKLVGHLFFQGQDHALFEFLGCEQARGFVVEDIPGESFQNGHLFHLSTFWGIVIFFTGSRDVGLWRMCEQMFVHLLED